MKIKKTFSNWLTNRFLLIIRNEENFAEKRTFSFNYAKLIVFGITFLIIVFSLSFYLINTVLFAWLNPLHGQVETNKKIVVLSSMVDSLSIEVQRKDNYIMNFRKLLMGETTLNDQRSQVEDSKKPLKKDIELDKISAVDANFRKEIEEEEVSLLYTDEVGENREDNYFMRPVDGVITTKYNPKSGNFGIDIVTKSRETVKSIADGMVIFSNFNDEGYVIAIQHKNGLISLYECNSSLLKHSGEFVNASDPIAMTGNMADSGKKYKSHFQLWQDGSPLNPENYISF